MANKVEHLSLYLLAICSLSFYPLNRVFEQKLYIFMKSYLPTFLFMDSTFESPRVGLFFFLFVFGHSRATLSRSSLFLWSLERASFCWIFFNVRTYWRFRVAFFFSSQFGAYAAQRKSQRTHHLVIPWALKALTSLLSYSYYSDFLYFNFIYIYLFYI